MTTNVKTNTSQQSSLRTEIYPPIQPYNTGFIQVSNLHKIYFEEAGNPNGVPIVFLHGGPGGGLHPEYRQLFDPSYYRIILFDQRGCGQSTPFAELKENTTWDLVSDMEKIRTQLKITKWFVFGGSWGTTLALSYGLRHADKVLGFILRGIFLCRPHEIKWFYQEGADKIFPDLWEGFLKPIPENERHDLVTAYHKRLTSSDSKAQLECALAWSKWEAATSRLLISPSAVEAFDDAQVALPFARIECHYFINNVFFETNNYILENVQKMSHIPCKIIHGRYDIVCPVESAWSLHKLWPKSELEIIADSGHSMGEVGIQKALVKATESFKKISHH
jgi:proline iminopeptidase